MTDIPHSTSCVPSRVDDYSIWQERVFRALRALGGGSPLDEIHRMVVKQNPGVRKDPQWKDNIWNVLMLDPEIELPWEDFWELLSYDEDEDEAE